MTRNAPQFISSCTFFCLALFALPTACSALMPDVVRSQKSAAGAPYCKADFDGATLLGPIEDCHSGECYQSILGECGSGAKWPPNFWGSNQGPYRQGGWLQLLADTSPLTNSNVSDYASAELRTMVGHSGQSTRTLYLRTDGGNVGCPSCRNYQGKGGGRQLVYILAPQLEPVAQPEGDFYLSYWLYLQEDLASQIVAGKEPDGSAGDWRVIMELKTGGQARNGRNKCFADSPGVYGGDYRITVDIIHDAGGLFWRMQADNNANGGEAFTPFWQVSDHRGPGQSPLHPIPLRRWFKVEWFVHRDATHGRAWFAANGSVILDQIGGVFYGDHHCQINRIVPFEVYTGGKYPQYEWVDDFEFWPGFPQDASQPH